jgi:hypothetical protein
MHAPSVSWVVLLAACGGPGCASYGQFLEEQADFAPTAGTIESFGGPTGTWTIQVSDCDSGMRDGFYGVTLRAADSRHSVRLVRNPVGPMTLAVNVPGADEFLEVPCRAVVGSVQRTGTRINSVPVLKGDVRFVCEGLRGSATFTCS